MSPKAPFEYLELSMSYYSMLSYLQNKL